MTEEERHRLVGVELIVEMSWLTVSRIIKVTKYVMNQYLFTVAEVELMVCSVHDELSEESLIIQSVVKRYVSCHHRVILMMIGDPGDGPSLTVDDLNI